MHVRYHVTIPVRVAFDSHSCVTVVFVCLFSSTVAGVLTLLIGTVCVTALWNSQLKYVTSYGLHIHLWQVSCSSVLYETKCLLVMLDV